MIYSKGSGVNDSIFGKSQEPIKALISDKVESFEKTSMLDKVFNIQSSDKFAEKFTSEVGGGDFEDVGENGAYPKTSMQEGYSKVIEPHVWKSSFEVTKEMMEDALMGKIKKKANKFTLSYNRTREKFGAALLSGATGSSITFGTKAYDTTTADSVSLFNKEHPSILNSKLKQSNIFTGAFSLSNMDTIQEKMQQFKDDDGNILAVMPDTIIIPNVASLKRAVFAAIGSDLDPDTANNAFNFQVGLWNVIVWNYLPTNLGSKPYFFMMDSQYVKDYECTPWLDRVPLEVSSDIDPNTDANIWKGRARFGAGFTDWRGLAICGEGLTGTALA